MAARRSRRMLDEATEWVSEQGEEGIEEEA